MDLGTVQAEVPHKRIGELLALLDKRLWELEDAQGHPHFGPVRQKRAVLHMLELVGTLRDALLGLLASSTAGRQGLRHFCGEDCWQIAHIRNLIEMLANHLSGSNLAEDARLKGCADACSAVEGVLQDSALGARLVEAQQRGREIRKHLEDTRLKGCDRDHAKDLLECLDVLDRPVAGSALHIVDSLFDFYDTDGNQLLEGQEYENVIADLAEHVMEEAKARSAKYGGATFVPSARVLRDWIKEVIDPNADGAITREEARIGFKKVVDDID